MSENTSEKILNLSILGKLNKVFVTSIQKYLNQFAYRMDAPVLNGSIRFTCHKE
jgi:hypothetical protein